MKTFCKRFYSIVEINTLIAIIIAVGSTAISLHYGWQMDFPLTIVGIAVVFPIVFSIGGAYTRRESALTQYAIMKSMGRSIYLAGRDWLRDSDEKALRNINDFKEQVTNVFSLCINFFQSPREQHFSEAELNIYNEFSTLSKTIEDLRDRGLSGSEVSRVHAYLNRFITAFETIKHIYQYRTPRTLRLYSKFFIYAILIALGPYFALLAESQVLWLTYIKPILFAMVFTGLDNIQEHLENPFDQIGEDDIRINPEKFKKTLN
jgi:hypothetical protein